MAYGNWGAFVYKNGERQRSREDNTPFSEDELAAGYWQAFSGNNPDGTRVGTGKQLHCVHASLGSGPFRLCGYKDYPIIYWNGEEVSWEPYAKVQEKFSDGSVSWYTDEDQEIEGELNGYKFKATHDGDGNPKIHLEVIEPDGTQWTGTSGMYMGSGYED